MGLLSAVLFFSVQFTVLVFDEASLAKSQVAKSIEKSRHAVDSLELTYKGFSNLDAGDAVYAWREIATKRPCLFFHHGAHGNDRSGWQDDIRQQRAFVRDDIFFNEFPLQRTYFYGKISPNDPLPGTLHGEVWFEFTGFWPLDREPPQLYGLFPMIHEVVESDQYRFRKQLALVGDTHCCVLEKTSEDVLWLDPQKGFALIQRQVSDPKSGRLLAQLNLSAHASLGNGVWLPARIRNRMFGWETGEKRTTVDAVIEVQELKINHLQMGNFIFHPKPGSIAHEDIDVGNARQAVPWGSEHLDQITRWVIRMNGPAVRSRSPFFVYLGVSILTFACLRACRLLSDR